MTTVTVRYWAGAQRAAGTEFESLPAATVAQLRELLAARPPLARISAVASFLVDGRRATDATVLSDGDQVDVLPPFAGGADAHGEADADVAARQARLTAVVHGQVQGVGFRDWTRRQTDRVSVFCTATNLADGTVEVLASGARAACQALVDTLRGPQAPVRVDTVEVKWQ